MKRLEKIADELKHSTYKDPVHGQIARDNFVYGVAQAKVEITDKICEFLEENQAHIINKTGVWFAFSFWEKSLRMKIDECLKVE